MDLAVLPWLFGASWLPKLVLALLPFGFLSLPNRDVKIVFIIALVYLRVTSDFNLGLLFLALMIFLFFERWFLVNFFHRSAWQTLVLSGLGVAVFYAVMLGSSWAFDPAAFALNPALFMALLISSLSAAGASFLFNKFAQ